MKFLSHVQIQRQDEAEQIERQRREAAERLKSWLPACPGVRNGRIGRGRSAIRGAGYSGGAPNLYS